MVTATLAAAAAAAAAVVVEVVVVVVVVVVEVVRTQDVVFMISYGVDKKKKNIVLFRGKKKNVI